MRFNMQLAMEILYKSYMALRKIIISDDIIGWMTIHGTHILNNDTLGHNNNEYENEYVIGYEYTIKIMYGF